MLNHHANGRPSNDQPSSLASVDEIHRLQQEMALLTAHIAKLTAKQCSPAPKPLTPFLQSLMQVQPIGQHLSGAHLLTCSFHGLCTHSNADCQAQCPTGVIDNNIAKGGCYVTFVVRTPTRPCPHCRQV
uniref:Uncharacterized protein n=1 Tax=Romanomermis culicivorax TaxID=13658 RepID=A0A915L3U1_ROMCU